MNDCPVENLEHIKHLVIIIGQNLKWTEHVRTKLKKTQRCFFFVKQTFQWQTPSEKKFNPYSSLTLSDLLDRVRAWSPVNTFENNASNGFCYEDNIPETTQKSLQFTKTSGY